MAIGHVYSRRGHQQGETGFKLEIVGNDWEFLNGLGTLALGLSYSTDDIEPSEATLFIRVSDEEKRSRSFSAAWAQILNKTSLFQAGLSITKRWGLRIWIERGVQSRRLGNRPCRGALYRERRLRSE